MHSRGEVVSVTGVKVFKISQSTWHKENFRVEYDYVINFTEGEPVHNYKSTWLQGSDELDVFAQSAPILSERIRYWIRTNYDQHNFPIVFAEGVCLTE